MKRILKVSLVAMLMASPLMAYADDPTTATRYSADYEEINVPVPTTDPVAPTADIASTSYVQGAYNEAVHIINQENKRALAAEAGLDARLDTLEADSLTAQSVDYRIKHQAENAVYTNTTSGLSAGTIKGAIDEVEGRVDGLEARTTVAAKSTGNYVAISANNQVNSNLVALDNAVAEIQNNDGALTADGHYIKKNNTVAQNLSALDTRGYTNETAIALLNNSDNTVAGSVKNSIKTQAKDADYTNSSMANITTISGAIGNLDTRLDTAETTIGSGTLGTNAQTLKAAINELDARVVKVRTTWGSSATALADVIQNPS